MVLMGIFSWIAEKVIKKRKENEMEEKKENGEEIKAMIGLVNIYIKNIYKKEDLGNIQNRIKRHK